MHPENIQYTDSTVKALQRIADAPATSEQLQRCDEVERQPVCRQVGEVAKLQLTQGMNL